MMCNLVLSEIEVVIEFVTCGVELLRGHCTDIPADQGVILGDLCYLLFLKTFHYNYD